MNKIIDLNPQTHHIVDFQLEALKLLGLDCFTESMKIRLPDALDGEIERLIPGISKKNSLCVCIHPGAAKIFRQWPPDRFGIIASRLREKYCAEVILLSGKHEKHLIEAVESKMEFPAFFKSGDLSLQELACILKKSDLLIANDSAPGHIAAGVDCRSLILFGPTFPHMWRPYSPKSEVVFKNVSCCGCRQTVCIRQDSNCMNLIGVEEVWEKTESLLKIAMSHAE